MLGIGGVGSYTAEALARAGIGHLVLVDRDTVSLSNINRQLVALHSTVGQFKTQVMKERIADINPAATVEAHAVFVLPENIEEILSPSLDYIVDAVDTVAAKLALVEYGIKYNIPVISAMGAGNKLDPTKLEVADIYATSVCPLCRVMRNELRKRQVKSLKVVFSTQAPLSPDQSLLPLTEQELRRFTPGSVPFVPSVAGLIIAGEVVQDLLFRAANKTQEACPTDPNRLKSAVESKKS